ncbi:MAG: hypothetical protein ACFE0K_07490 [Alcanivorax sp.]|uniref:hypothetical protein n=1 Tax=Alcanivorax sp. TaxID=1872427 RepID=UPI003DA6D84F
MMAWSYAACFLPAVEAGTEGKASAAGMIDKSRAFELAIVQADAGENCCSWV